MRNLITKISDLLTDSPMLYTSKVDTGLCFSANFPTFLNFCIPSPCYPWPEWANFLCPTPLPLLQI